MLLSTIFFALGDDAFNPHGKLEPILRQAKAEKFPMASTRQLRNWYNHYLMYGETMAETRLWGEIGLQRNYRNERYWQTSDTDALRQIVTDKPSLYLDEIRERLGFQTARWWDSSTIYKKINEELKMSLQVVSIHAKQRDEEQRQRYRKGLDCFLAHVKQLVFLDETHKGRSASRRRRHWALRNHSPILRETFVSKHSKRYSMIAAYDVNGFILETCKCFSREPNALGKTRTIDGTQFIEWLHELLLPILTPYDLFGSRSLVVLDNASIHHSDAVVELIESTGTKVIYLAPYSPDLNPIELMFGVYKAALKRHETKSADQAHLIALCSFTPAKARGFFRRCGLLGCEKIEEEEEETGLAAAAIALQQSMLLKITIMKLKGLP